MAIEAEDIVDRETFRQWLDGKDISISHAMAARIALRAWPLVLSVYNHNRVDDEIKSVLTLSSFRATVLSTVASNSPTVDMPADARASSFAAADARASSFAAAAAAARAAEAAADDARTSSSAAAAARACSFAAAARAAADARTSSVAAAVRVAAAADDAARAAATIDDAEKKFWIALRADAQMLTMGSAAELSQQPLWMALVDKGIFHTTSAPDWAHGNLSATAALPHFKDGPWGVLLSGYETKLGSPERGFFGKELDIEIATKPNAFWDRDADVVVAEIAEIVGWSSSKFRIEDDIPPFVPATDFIEHYLRRSDRPLSNQEIADALKAAGISIRSDSLNWTLSRMNRDGRIVRIERGHYWHPDHQEAVETKEQQKGTSSNERKAVEGIASPFEYGWNLAGKLQPCGGGMDAISVPPSRSPEDAERRLDAASVTASNLLNDLAQGQFQVRQSYRDGIKRYLKHLPNDSDGAIYLSDTEIRNLLDDLEADLKFGIDERFARRLKRMIEQHYGVRPYFPDLLTFYDDVREGRLTEPPPMDTISKLEGVVHDNTPDVFESETEESLRDLSPESKEEPITSELAEESDVPESIDLPKDPIANVDPERASQHARAGALNKMLGAFDKVEAGSKNIERIKKVGKTFRSVGEPLWKYLEEFIKSGGGGG